MNTMRLSAAIALMLFSAMALADRVTCESKKGTRVTCRMDTSGEVNMVKQLSRAPCVQGTTWGVQRHGVWVDRGCRGVFASDTERGYGRRDDTRPDVDVDARGSGRVRFNNNCVVYYRHGRRTDQTRECDSNQVRRADDSVEAGQGAYGRGQGTPSGNVGREWDRGCSDAKGGSYDRSRHSQAYEEGWQACRRN
jgi:hypothetical protein